MCIGYWCIRYWCIILSSKFSFKKNPALMRGLFYTKLYFYTPTTPSNQKITLTMSQETHINTNPIPACCKILNPFLYFASSPAAVIIENPPKRRITNATSANIPNARLMKLLITSISFPPCAVPVQDIPIPAVPAASPNDVVTAGVCA